MLNLKTLILGLPRTCPLTGLQNEPKYSERQTEFGTVNWTPYLLTHNDVAYWRFENSYIYSSYSKKDSIVYDYINDNLTQPRQLPWEAKYGKKFRFSGDTLFLLVKDKDYCYSCDSFLVQLTKNQMVLHNLRFPMGGGDGTYYRLGRKEIRKLLNYDKKCHTYNLTTADVKIQLPQNYIEEKEIYKHGEAYFIHCIDDGATIIISGGILPNDKDYTKSSDYNLIEHTTSNGIDKYYGQLSSHHCRTDIVNDVFYDIRISYFDVTDKNKKKYDKMFDDIKIYITKYF